MFLSRAHRRPCSNLAIRRSDLHLSMVVEWKLWRSFLLSQCCKRKKFFENQIDLKVIRWGWGFERIVLCIKTVLTFQKQMYWKNNIFRTIQYYRAREFGYFPWPLDLMFSVTGPLSPWCRKWRKLEKRFWLKLQHKGEAAPGCSFTHIDLTNKHTCWCVFCLFWIYQIEPCASTFRYNRFFKFFEIVKFATNSSNLNGQINGMYLLGVDQW